MENTKVPKSFLKPPSRIVKPGTLSKLLSTGISENKPPEPAVSTTKMKSTVTSQNAAHKLFLRRRSNSVSDLRQLTSKPITLTTGRQLSKVINEKPAPSKPGQKRSATEKADEENKLRRRSKSASDLRQLTSKPVTLTNGRQLKPINEKAAPGKSAQKRPATQKVDEENKHKVPKMKIPDWDYKSRFQDLQKRYAVVQEENKTMKSTIAKLSELEKEVIMLKQEKENSESLQKKVISLTRDIESLLKENSRVKTVLSKQEVAYDNLKLDHDRVSEENRENKAHIEKLQTALQESEKNIDSFKNRCDSLEATIRQMKQDILHNENLRRSLHNTVQDLKGNIRVFCRVRPPINNEENDKQLCAIFFPNETNLEIRKMRESVSTTCGKPMDLKQEFSFDKVFPPEANQAEVFEELSQLVQSALDGYHVCVFAYGQTGSGKTYTMQGSPMDLGMIPRTIDLIFEKISQLARIDWTYTVSASFLEIYNENIRDLLKPDSSYNYELRYNEGRGVTVTNLKNVDISSAAELKHLMEEAQRNRAVAATDFNEHSSRSHAVVKIHLEGFNTFTKVKYAGSINLVDLAGSESAKTSAAERLVETKNINKSLSTLGNVMLALHNKDPHIPYRNSKLTFLLQSCLGGNSKTLMFVNISPFEECFSESINSLRFASKVKEIKINAKRNKMYGVAPSN